MDTAIQLACQAPRAGAQRTETNSEDMVPSWSLAPSPDALAASSDSSFSADDVVTADDIIEEDLAAENGSKSKKESRKSARSV